MRLSDYVMQYLYEHGVKHAFYLPGGGAMYLMDALGQSKIESFRCLNEQVCGVAADVYAQIAGIGLCLVTSGPGATNAITACAAAWTDSCPTIFISGQVRRDQLIGGTGLRMHGIQEVDIIPIVKPITKWAERLMRPERVGFTLDTAIHYATKGRKGPIWIDIPQDVQAAEINPEKLAHGKFYEYKPELPDISPLMQDLKKAHRPVIVVGAGILPHDVEFRQLARILNVPVLTSYRMYGLFNWDDPLWFGRPGNGGIPYASRILQNADFILSIGTRMSWNLTGYNLKDFAPYASKWYAVDIDPAELAKHQRVIPILADAGDFLKTIIDDAEHLNCDNWLKTCQEWKANYAMPQFTENGYMPQEVARLLQAGYTSDCVICPCSSGLDIDGFYQGLRCKEGQYVHVLPDFGAIGFGLAAAIGACLASNRQRTLCVEGDGGYLLNSSTWETVKEYNLPIDYYILNNGVYGAIQATEDNYFEGRRMGSDLPETEIPQGIHQFKIDPSFRLPKPHVQIINGLPQAATIEENLEWPEL